MPERSNQLIKRLLAMNFESVLRHVRLVAFLVAAFFLPDIAEAQSGATVAGRVVSDEDATPVAQSPVAVQDADGVTVSGTIAGADGRFVLRGLEPGRYTLHVTYPGFAAGEASLVVSPLNSTYDLGDIRLTPQAIELQGITVTADAVDAAAVDAQVFRLDEGAAQSTGSVLDAMRNLPGVTVDQDGRVSLRGSDQVAVLIDGRPSSLTGFGNQRGLDNISAANIEAIEIIHNPSASFDAAGMAGIINIIYEENTSQGLAADLGMSLGMGQFTKQRADLPTELGSYSANEKIIPSVSLNYGTERTRTFARGEFYAQHDLPNNEFTTRYYDDGRVIESQVPENRQQTHYTGQLGSDFRIDGFNTLTLAGVYDVETHTDRAQVPFILASTGERQRYWFWREKETTGFANAALNLSHAFAEPGHELVANLQYTRGWEDEAYFLNEESSIRVGDDMTHLIAEENTLPLSIDYTRPLSTGRLEVGTKLQRRWIPITYDVARGNQSVIYNGLGDTSEWDEDIVAVYGNLVRIAEGYTLEAGVRVEQTGVTYTIPAENIYYNGSDAYDYLEVFPNVKLSIALDASNHVIAAYNRRIDRPGEPELRIFPKYDDPELLKVGNPFLRPQLTNVFEVGYGRSWSGGSLDAAVYHRDISDGFLRVLAVDDSNPAYDIVNRIYENAANSRQTGLELIAQQQVLDNWLVSASTNLFNKSIDALQTTLFFPTARSFAVPESSDASWDATLNNRIGVPGGGDLQASYIYYAARNIPQGRERARSSLDLSAEWPLMNERAEVVFTVTDLFNNFGIEQEIAGDGFTAVYQNFLETQVATVGFRVRF